MSEFEPVATREFRQGDTPVLLSFGKPDPNDDGIDYGCTFRVDGLASGPLEIRIVGIDEVQALIEAMKVARASLEREGLTFLGEPGLRLRLS
jgi:hypothetical protein